MSFLDSFAESAKVAFFEEKVPAPGGSAPGGSVPAANLVATATPSGPAMVFTPAVATDPADGFLPKLRAKFQNPNSVVDKFEDILSSLTAIADMDLRVKTAVNVIAKTVGAGVVQIQDAYAARSVILDQQVAQFTQAISAQSSAEVSAREDQVRQIAADIEAKGREIQELSVKRESLNAEISTAKNKLAAAQLGFDGAVATVRAELQEAVGRLKGI